MSDNEPVLYELRQIRSEQGRTSIKLAKLTGVVETKFQQMTRDIDSLRPLPSQVAVAEERLDQLESAVEATGKHIPVEMDVPKAAELGLAGKLVDVATPYVTKAAAPVLLALAIGWLAGHGCEPAAKMVPPASSVAR